MNKLQMLRLTNASLLVVFIVQAITSLIIIFRIRIPNMKLIFEIHEYNGLLMIALAIIHIILNFGWMRANFFKKRTSKV